MKFQKIRPQMLDYVIPEWDNAGFVAFRYTGITEKISLNVRSLWNRRHICMTAV